MIRATLILLAIAAPARADEWSAGDTFAEAGVGLVLAADYLQTRAICADMRAGTAPDWVRETNPVMGSSCDRVPPEVYFAGVLLVHVAVARALPRPLRRAWQGLAIAIEIDPIARNLNAGYSIRW